MTISVVMPVYNEAKTIEEVIQRVQAVAIDKEIIIVDDFSTDGTRAQLERLQKVGNVQLIYHDTNRGKGAALRTAFTQVNGEIVVIQDADLEYDPQDYFKLIEPITAGRADGSLRFTFHGRSFSSCSLFLALYREQASHISVQLLHQFKPDGYGGVLQSVPTRNTPQHYNRGEPIRN